MAFGFKLFYSHFSCVTFHQVGSWRFWYGVIFLKKHFSHREKTLFTYLWCAEDTTKISLENSCEKVSLFYRFAVEVQ